ncbi:hypothetical protein CH63R_13313 [Colletotrichum higginsianum IMI 349063]|uniref:Uncharacterized protein n=1 Tax=Colletotrichum higginsianum (strain IMI 349063) TaxID=759273 RepID=A0A1B7XWN9_COLHI|nr:hypothetical protein CH63R_13313 [Colletotrichum higginsianum IMI 349063]OBR04186.1 hypothetical protein CH63R_13313 [Colletotrichum higginsianum IMI 349063]
MWSDREGLRFTSLWRTPAPEVRAIGGVEILLAESGFEVSVVSRVMQNAKRVSPGAVADAEDPQGTVDATKVVREAEGGSSGGGYGVDTIGVDDVASEDADGSGEMNWPEWKPSTPQKAAPVMALANNYAFSSILLFFVFPRRLTRRIRIHPRQVRSKFYLVALSNASCHALIGTFPLLPCLW